MNEIIAAQRVRRRKKPSFLAAASEFRDTAIIIEDQKPRFNQRQTRVVLETVKTYPLKKIRFPRIRRIISEKPQKKLILPGVVLVLLLGFLIFSESFIPDPEPPAGGVPPDHIFEAALDEGEAGELPDLLIETFSWKDYTVRPGDTVEGIAKYFGLSIDAIIASNNIANVRRGLVAGNKIRIPNMDGIPYTVKRGDTYRKIANTMKVPEEAILDANDIQSTEIYPGTVLFIPGAKMKVEDLRQALGELFIYPVRGRITSGFGWRIDPIERIRLYHTGLDLASPMGAPVKASAAGRVLATGTSSIYGYYVIVGHTNTYQTMYGHLSRILVKKGQSIVQGDIIGRVGNTGRSTGAHLHFTVYKNGSLINPLEILGK